MKLKNIYLSLVSAIIIISCAKPENHSSGTDSSTTTYDRSALLANLTNNIIIPAFSNFETKLNGFNETLTRFNLNQDVENLMAMQNSFVETYLAWQHVEMFNIDKAEELFYAQKMNIYPSNVSRIEANMDSPNVDLNANQNDWAAQGLPAIDYMLFGLESTNEDITQKYAVNAGANAYLQYLNLLVEQMVHNTNEITTYWNTNKANFIAANGNSSTASLNVLANDYVYYFEKGLRANKIGIPAGVFSRTLPQNVESLYKRNISKALALEALHASKNFFLGTHFNGTTQGESLKSYLDFMTESTDLSSEIISKFDIAIEKINTLEDDFHHMVNDHNQKMLESYDALQATVIHLKTDMLSALGISVDYVDADGD